MELTDSIENRDELLSKVAGCESLTLCFKIVDGFNTIPYISSVKELFFQYEVESLRMNIQPLIKYSTHLWHLVLKNCSISDVSMSGNVPQLELLNCENLTALSLLYNYIAFKHDLM